LLNMLSFTCCMLVESANVYGPTSPLVCLKRNCTVLDAMRRDAAVAGRLQASTTARITQDGTDVGYSLEKKAHARFKKRD